MFLRLDRHTITSLLLLFELHVSLDQVTGGRFRVQGHGRQEQGHSLAAIGNLEREGANGSTPLAEDPSSSREAKLSSVR
jgi:hypothetical protein